MTFVKPTEQIVYVVSAQKFEQSIALARTWGQVFDIDKDQLTYKIKINKGETNANPNE